VLSKLAYLTLCRSIQLLALLARGDAAKDLEILVLRHQLTVLCRQVPRPKLQPADRALLAAVSRVLPRPRWSCFFVKPETLLGWHRRPVAGAWTHPHRQTGRPPLDQEEQQLIVRLAKENPRGGYQRFKGELQRLGVRVSATTIRTTLHRYGLDPACASGRRDRPPGQCLGHPAGPQLATGTGGAGTTGALPAARPGRKVLPQLRRRVPLRGRPGAGDAGAGADRERVRRTVGPKHGSREVTIPSHRLRTRSSRATSDFAHPSPISQKPGAG
jgi:hypothetical protein